MKADNRWKKNDLPEGWWAAGHHHFLSSFINNFINDSTQKESIGNIIKLEDQQDKQFLLEQYKILIEGINKNNENRETLNHFWITLNGTIIAAITYVKDMQFSIPAPKGLFIWVLWVGGVIFSLVWLTSLSSIKRNIDLKNEILIQMENLLPAKIFTTVLIVTGRRKGKNSLSSVEKIIPMLFCIGYIIMGAILYIYPNIV